MFKFISKAICFTSDKYESYELWNIALKKIYMSFILYLS